jgi:spore coat protein U-like protein
LGLTFAKLLRIPLTAAALAVTAAAPANAATVMAAVTASNVKPLIISKLQDLDFGSVTLGPGVWSNATISLSQAGVLTCANVNLTCTGATSVAQYNVQGSKQQPVQISAPNVTLVNQSDSTKTLTLITDSPSSIILTNNGFPGSDFSIGGSITINSTTAAGTYVGTFNVTVDY